MSMLYLMVRVEFKQVFKWFQVVMRVEGRTSKMSLTKLCLVEIMILEQLMLHTQNNDNGLLNTPQQIKR